MNREFLGVYQVAKQRYNLSYSVRYKMDCCILKIYRDGKLVIMVSDETQERMYEVAADRLKSYVSLNESSHA